MKAWIEEDKNCNTILVLFVTDNTNFILRFIYHREGDTWFTNSIWSSDNVPTLATLDELKTFCIKKNLS